jgi:hypothetical protein
MYGDIQYLAAEDDKLANIYHRMKFVYGDVRILGSCL